MAARERPSNGSAAPLTGPAPGSFLQMDRALAAIDNAGETRSTGGLVPGRPSSAMFTQAPQAQGSFPSRRKWVLLATAIGAGSGALAGAVAPASACMTTTSINGGPLQCNDRGATIGAFAFGGALGGLLIGLLAR